MAPTRPSPGARAMDRLIGRQLALPPATTGYAVDRGLRIPMRDGVALEAARA